MSNEEKEKAYEFLQELNKSGYEYTANGKEKYIVENVFRKIDKLQKENEELKAINSMQKYRIEVIDERELISKDKIRNKIKELEEIKLLQTDSIFMDSLNGATSILKELLGDDK